MFEKYSAQLIKHGIVKQDEMESWEESINEENESAYTSSKHYVADPAEWIASNWQGKTDSRPFLSLNINLNLNLNLNLNMYLT